MKRTLKGAVCLLLVICLLSSCVTAFTACKLGKHEDNSFTPVQDYTDPALYGGDPVFGGSLTTSKSPIGNEGVVGGEAYVGIAGKDYTDKRTYTYNDYLAATTGLNWNPLSWQTSDDSYVLDYLSVGFYDFVLNPTLDGYSVICEMAAELPVDVTSDYVGRYGIEEGDSAIAWKIALNPSATWQDGTPITADDYIYSMQQQLDPRALYRRADSYYAGDFQLYNAKAYVYQGQRVVSEAAVDGFALSDLTLGTNGGYTVGGEAAFINLDTALDWLDGYSLASCVDEYGEKYFDVTAYEALAAMADENGSIPLTEAALEKLTQVITAVEAWGESAEQAINYVLYNYEYPPLSWEEVGLKKLDDHTIVFISTAPTAQPGFYLPYNLSSTWLVNKPLFESSKSYYDADGNRLASDSDAVVKVVSSYGTSPETTISYGPYKLASFQADKELLFVRNESWYGYSDGKHLGQYQTDRVHVAVIDKHDTALLSFLQGDVDLIGLTSKDMDTYSSSERILYTPEDYTTKLTFNTDYESLLSLGNNQQLLSLVEFRTAFALAIDREEFVSAHTSAGEAGFGLLNYMYCYDPFTGAIYRESDYAKKALVELNGLTYGEGGDYEDLDSAYNAMTGYDLAAARELMQRAYDKAVDAGIYDGKSAVRLTFTVYQNDETYVNMFNFFDAAIKAATVGTDFEGLVSLAMESDEDYYTTMNSGGTAMIFTTWGGSAMSPFGVLSRVYTDASDGSGNQNEYGYETDRIMVTINVDGIDVTASLTDWSDWCGSASVPSLEEKLGPFTDYDYESRCAIFAIIERVYLEGYATTPLYYRNSASLLSYKLDYASEDYLQIVGRGGLRYATYNYDDTEWAGVKGSLDYTASSGD